MNYPHPIIAREGWPFIGIALLLAILVHALGGFGWAWPFWLLVVFVVQFFRDPPRSIPADPNAVLSPADGRIVAIETVLDPYAQREAMKISVFMNVFNAHSQRSPVDGTVRRVQYFPGAFLNAELDKASLQNERNALIFDLPGGVVISCVQVAGLVARRILCYVREGETLKRGQRYGFIRFGSRLDVYLPLGARPRVSIGEKVFASSTILAELGEPIAVTPEAPFATAPAGATVTDTVASPVSPTSPVQPTSPLTSAEPVGQGVATAPLAGAAGIASEVGIGSEAAPK
ncbi:phosphatidylserine decarboxylase [Robbsia andropogonis]